MKIELNDEWLKVGRHKCESITIVKGDDGVYRATAYHMEGFVKTKFRINRFGRKESYTVGIRKNFKFKRFEYSGIQLKEYKLQKWEGYKKYLFAQNKKGDYVNYYE